MDSLLISSVNQYAAYSLANKDEQNISELSKLAKNEKVSESKASVDDDSLYMDKVVISQEALEKLASSLAK